MSAIPLARLLGFEVRIHVSWVLVLAVVVVSVATRTDLVDVAADPLVVWALGATVAVGFLLSAVAHELAHAVVARRAGAPTGPVVVYFFGSAASPVIEVARPRDEVAAALAGPFTSLAVGAVAAAVGAVGVAAGAGAIAVVGDALLLIGVLSIVLGAANLVPVFPLDGGRVARGLAWWRIGDPVRALRWTTDLGRWLGIGLAVIGAGVVIQLDTADGVMLALCGWLLISQARAIERTADMERLLDGMAVREVMDAHPIRVPAGVTLETFADRLLGPGDAVQVAQGAEVVGVVGTRQVRRVRRDRWAETRAADVMTTQEVVPAIGPEVSVRAALELFRRAEIDGVAVTEGGAVTGIVTRRAVGEAIRARAASRGRVA